MKVWFFFLIVFDRIRFKFVKTGQILWQKFEWNILGNYCDTFRVVQLVSCSLVLCTAQSSQLSSCYHCCQLLFLPPDSAFLEMRAKIWICYWYTVDLFGFNFIHISEQKGTVQNYAHPIFANPHLFMYKIITGCFTKKAKLGW